MNNFTAPAACLAPHPVAAESPACPVCADLPLHLQVPVAPRPGQREDSESRSRSESATPSGARPRICRRERVERVWSVERYDAAAAAEVQVTPMSRLLACPAGALLSSPSFACGSARSSALSCLPDALPVAGSPLSASSSCTIVGDLRVCRLVEHTYIEGNAAAFRRHADGVDARRRYRIDDTPLRHDCRRCRCAYVCALPQSAAGAMQTDRSSGGVLRRVPFCDCTHVVYTNLIANW